MKLKIINWQQSLTEHQVHLWRAINEYADVELKIIETCGQARTRSTQGWKPPDKKNLAVQRIAYPWLGILAVIRSRDELHIFNTMWGNRTTFLIFLSAVLLNRRVVIMSEPYATVPYGYDVDENKLILRLKIIIRKLCYRLAGSMFSRRVERVFAISPEGVKQFRRVGFRQVSPFGYFIPLEKRHARCETRREGPIRCAYVGSLIRRKGYDLLLDALEGANPKKIHLDLYGHGALKNTNLGELVTFKGKIPFGETPSVLSSYDLLVVPSRFDGWSVVINEAIGAGIPIIASRYVGAAAVVDHFNVGETYDGTSKSLGLLLSIIAENPARLKQYHTRMEEAQVALSPASAANYLRMKILQLDVKENLWYSVAP